MRGHQHLRHPVHWKFRIEKGTFKNLDLKSGRGGHMSLVMPLQGRVHARDPLFSEQMHLAALATVAPPLINFLCSKDRDAFWSILPNVSFPKKCHRAFNMWANIKMWLKYLAIIGEPKYVMAPPSSTLVGPRGSYAHELLLRMICYCFV